MLLLRSQHQCADGKALWNSRRVSLSRCLLFECRSSINCRLSLANWAVPTHANPVLIKSGAGFVFFPLYSYIIRNAKKWCTSKDGHSRGCRHHRLRGKLAPIHRGFPAGLDPDAECFPHSGPIGVSKNHVSLYGSSVLGDHLTIWTSNGL
jgi:hypothetical protein